MERFFAASQNSPLEMLRMLEGNLRREQYIFAVAVGLLILTSLCGAVVTSLFLASATLKSEQVGAQAATHDVNIAIFNRYAIVMPGGILLNFNAKNPGAPALNPVEKPHCQPYPSDHKDLVLSRSCEEAWHSTLGADSSPGLQFASYDGTASYGFNFFDKIDQSSTAAGALKTLVGAAKDYMSASGVDPLDVARTRRVMWFRSPPSVGFPRSTIFIFTVVAKEGLPYGIVFAELNLDETLAAATPDTQISELAIFDAQGQPVAGSASERTRFMAQHLGRSTPAEVYWTFSHGWGLALPVLDLKVGHIVSALSVSRLLMARRLEFSVILLVTTALVSMLLVIYRHWNYRVLRPTYERTCRAVEGEILNHLLVQATPVALCIALRKGFRVLAANHVARSVLGFDDVAGHLPSSLCEAFEARGIEPPESALDNSTRQFDYALAKPDGGMLHLKVSYTSAVVNKAHVVFCARADITEQHEAQQFLREAKETSEAAAKAKLSFFASMSHEIRTPLSSLVGNLELVALGSLAPEQAARVRAMQASASALLHVVNDVLDFSKMDIGEMRLNEEWGSIFHLVMRVMIGHAPLASRQGLRLFAVIDSRCPRRLYFDPIRIAQILNNLLGNALKFTHSGKIVVRVIGDDTAVELSVADSGIGIPADQHDALFQPFVQGDTHRLTQARGTGLGLPICRHLAHLMNGRISLESTEGVGTRIAVSLPLRADHTMQAGDEAAFSGSVAILCRANEFREWFDNLYDQRSSSLLYIAGGESAIDTAAYDYLITTDEFTLREIDAVWKDRSRVLHVSQNGPLVPVAREDGTIEVSIFELAGFRTAVERVTNRRDLGPLPDEAACTGPATVAHEAGPCVLIAEDNSLNRDLLRDQLRTLGATVIEAADGDEAVELFRKHRVDIVLTDMDMPKKGGADVLAAVRMLDPTVRVYALSASASAQDIENGRARGFTDYLTKPAPLAVLAEALQAHVAESDEVLPPRFPTIRAAFVRTLVAQLTKDIAGLDEIRATHDIRTLRRWAHKVSGGLSVLGPSMLLEQCEALRDTLRECSDWSDDVEIFVDSIRADLIALRDTQPALSQA